MKHLKFRPGEALCGIHMLDESMLVEFIEDCTCDWCKRRFEFVEERILDDLANTSIDELIHKLKKKV
jgi:hypothetical protein